VTEEDRKTLTQATKIHHSATFFTSNLMWIVYEIESCLPSLC